MSSSLVKLIDSAIFPAALLIISKVFGLYLGIAIFGLEWQMEFVNNSIFSVYPVVYESDLAILSSISDAVMILVMCIGFGWVVFRSIHLHETHIDPRTVAKLAKYNALGLVKSSYKIYHSASMWFVFTGIAVALSIYNAILGRTLWFVPLIGFFIFLTISIYLLRDIENEIELSKKKLTF